MTSAPTDPASASYDVELLRVTKRFGAVPAVRDLTLRVQRGAFFSLLGPSGCGKTTTLRLIAGFEQPTEGEIRVGGVDVAGLPPYRRDVNTVFQHYALFPHMSVANNIAYGLRQRRVGKSEMERRVADALQMVRLSGTENRRPSQLSGGQQQRVALARALINRPTVLLLDEPLSALDLKLRQEMQSELKALQQRVGITFVYVTHDQAEAITLSDRIAVMNAGRLEQEGTPTEIYERPRTRFVADFIGLTNFLEGTVQDVQRLNDTERLVVVETTLGNVVCAGWQPDVRRGERVMLTLRPEKLHPLPPETVPEQGWNSVSGIVEQATFLGPQTEYRILVSERGEATTRTFTVRQQNMGASTTSERQAQSDGGFASTWRVFGPGERLTLAWRLEASLILREPDVNAREEAVEDVDGAAPPHHASYVT